MAKPTFRAKQFTIQQDRCAQKVSTDGVLFGSWIDFGGAKQILDIGTGTGLLALIAAQRNENAQIDAVEIDPEAADQALENVKDSRWLERVAVHCKDVRLYEPDQRYDLIICNPPYYANYLSSPDPLNNIAKHSNELRFPDLLEAVNRLLTKDGRFCVIIPINRENDLLAVATRYGLDPTRRSTVSYVLADPPKRLILELDRSGKPLMEEPIIIQASGPFDYSAQYRAMISDLMIGF
ncbi:MAG: methyltransferase [Flavobacteriales bacterium]|nr:methyltransferase [Flavobacteriales bacterium]